MKLFAVNNNLPLIKYLPLTELFTIYKFGKSSNPHTSQSQSYKNNDSFFFLLEKSLKNSCISLYLHLNTFDLN